MSFAAVMVGVGPGDGGSQHLPRCGGPGADQAHGAHAVVVGALDAVGVVVGVVHAHLQRERHDGGEQCLADVERVAVRRDTGAGERFLKELVPFVFRKYLDFAAISDIHSIKRQIHAHKASKGAGATIALAGHDVVLLGERGHEFGTVTGRKRRCGWFDAVMVRQAVAVNGITGIALTKLDVLDGMEEIKVCVGYELDGARIDYLPASQGAQARLTPVYETLEGWSGTTAGARSWNDLPAQAVKYVRHVEELIGAPVAILSTSPERDDTILVTDPFQD